MSLTVFLLLKIRIYRLNSMKLALSNIMLYICKMISRLLRKCTKTLAGCLTPYQLYIFTLTGNHVNRELTHPPLLKLITSNLKQKWMVKAGLSSMLHFPSKIGINIKSSSFQKLLTCISLFKEAPKLYSV